MPPHHGVCLHLYNILQCRIRHPRLHAPHTLSALAKPCACTADLYCSPYPPQHPYYHSVVMLQLWVQASQTRDRKGSWDGIVTFNLVQPETVPLHQARSCVRIKGKLGQKRLPIALDTKRLAAEVMPPLTLTRQNSHKAELHCCTQFDNIHPSVNIKNSCVPKQPAFADHNRRSSGPQQTQQH